ncbi:MAG: hypothetical protein ACI8P0_001004 [Planctomycetaceae bacterium]
MVTVAETEEGVVAVAEGVVAVIDLSIKMDLEKVVRDILLEQVVLKEKVSKALECSGEEVSHAICEVIRFLHLAASNDSGMLTPSHRVDLAWHEFILCTVAYERFCTTNFGRFIHHTPGGPKEQNQLQYARTIELYIERFGVPDPSYWPTGRKNSECGPCES